MHLYGPVSPAKFGPWGDPARHVVLQTSWPCAPCDRLDWPPTALPQHACMAAITPEQSCARWLAGCADAIFIDRKENVSCLRPRC